MFGIGAFDNNAPDGIKYAKMLDGLLSLKQLLVALNSLKFIRERGQNTLYKMR